MEQRYYNVIGLRNKGPKQLGGAKRVRAGISKADARDIVAQQKRIEVYRGPIWTGQFEVFNVKRFESTVSSRRTIAYCEPA